MNLTDNLEPFLSWLWNGGWDKIEPYFYNSSEDEFIEKAMEVYLNSEI